MRSRLLRALALAFLAGLSVLGGVNARAANKEGSVATGGVSTCYLVDRQKSGFRTGLNGADTLTTAAILATTKFTLLANPDNGVVRQTVTVHGRFSNSGQTCQVQLARIYTDPAAVVTIKDYSNVYTLAGGTAQYEGSYFPSPLIELDSGGATELRILLIAAPAGGTVDLWVGSK